MRRGNQTVPWIGAFCIWTCFCDSASLCDMLACGSGLLMSCSYVLRPFCCVSCTRTVVVVVTLANTSSPNVPVVDVSVFRVSVHAPVSQSSHVTLQRFGPRLHPQFHSRKLCMFFVQDNTLNTLHPSHSLFCLFLTASGSMCAGLFLTASGTTQSVCFTSPSPKTTALS